MDQGLTHIDEDGNVTMVDVGHKPNTLRKAVFGTSVVVNARTMELLMNKALPKGDVLTTAKIAGIQAAKKTWELIPMCHPLLLSFLDVRFEVDTSRNIIHIQAEARTTAGTGVEMEALVAAQCAAMTIYDMCKAVQRDIVITDCKLLHKSGGRSGTYEYSG
ncbi:cyclic pyranopterin monophosphate synthase MoaC [Desulfoplanes formicivorans]|uniref:Cyclic pyranopterin monophosphate synthase n=1 Tax=Desulfoplanes formicivorans TaxID=1592317 RepID=A0A194AI83_9BACT|nr:cyclic pyranopterin monophosphate synthase MoaC [Desulfoplanes formicivorans]GAU09038.1 molybdenum cofactor biosynthesis protein MoaC [Desulfoplanes formicivorans]